MAIFDTGIRTKLAMTRMFTTNTKEYKITKTEETSPQIYGSIS